MSMLRYIDINFGAARVNDLLPVIEQYKTSYEYIKYLPKYIQAEVITHLQEPSNLIHEGVSYRGFRTGKSILNIPFKTLSYIKKQKPAVVLVQGMVFPLQVLMLKLFVGKRCRLIAQHHGEHPYKNRILHRLQKLADRCIDRYLFTSAGNAELWVNEGIISNREKCVEVPEASTFLAPRQKKESQQITGIDGKVKFLWVGRLIAGKDPFTVLQAFGKYVAITPDAHLYMIFQANDLLEEVKQIISESPVLPKNVHLIGVVPHDQLPYWYSAADYYISASHKEGSGYALIEAMACGCIPVVSDIPPFRALTHNGKAGFHFRKGDAQDLFTLLCSLETVDKEAFSNSIITHFQSELSFKSIADKIAAVIVDILHADALPIAT